MDFQICLLFSTCFLFIILTFKLFFTNHGLPPGPWQLPIIGSLHHFVSGAMPHHLLRDLSRKYGPIMHLQLGEISTVIISSPRLAEEVMKTRDPVFADRPTVAVAEILFYNNSNIGFSPYGDYWKYLRKMCALELFSPKRVKSFHSMRKQEVSRMVGTIESSLGLPINLRDEFTLLTSSVICKAAFSTSSKWEILAMTNEAALLVAAFHIIDLFPSIGILQHLTSSRSKIKFIHQKIDKAFDNIISERRETSIHPRDENRREGGDLLDVLLDFQQSKSTNFPFTDANIKAFILEIFLAGTETAATTIEWAMSEMLKNPQVMAKAQSEVRKRTQGIEDNASYLKLIIKETLRLHPPGPLLVPRQSREACKIDGYNIPEKTKLLINAWAIGRDPDIWEDAEMFIPERFENGSIDFTGNNFELIPFGAGRRICPGLSFAVAIIELALVQLLYHFNWTLPDGMNPEDLDMTETSGLGALRKNKLYAIADKYNQANI